MVQLLCELGLLCWLNFCESPVTETFNKLINKPWIVVRVGKLWVINQELYQGGNFMEK